MTVASTGAPGTPRPGAGPSPTRILAVLCLAQLMFGIDVTIVQVANPTIERALGFSAESLQWTVTAYALTFGGFLLLGGRLADLYGRRRVFALGMLGFAAASAGAGAAVDPTMLVLCRAGQGLGAAMVSPAVLGLLAQTFPEGAGRQRAYGLWASAISTGGITGYIVGGILIGVTGWRGIFYINVPVCLAAAYLATRMFPTASERKRTRLDLPGAVTVTTGIALVIFGLGQAESRGWAAATTIACLALAAAFIAAFVFVERTAPEPLLPLALLRRRQTVANLLAVLQSTSMGSSVFLNCLYLQQVYGYSPVATGLAVTPLSLALIVASNVSSRALGRVGPRVLSPLGLLCISAGILWLSRIGDSGSYATTYLPAVIAEGFGLGLGIVPLVNTATSGVTSEHQGLIGGMYNMSQQLGSALGIATLVTVVAAGTAAAHVGGVPAEAVGIRLGYRVGTFVALGGALIAALALPRRVASVPPVPEPALA
ncbi:MAG TPA: MFS transporter [Acidimicrobiales bacterium]|nr:MFS transporter [Acidimicrobiales bacterium]